MLTGKILAPLLRLLARRLGGRHPALAVQFFRAADDGSVGRGAFAHARAAWFAGDLDGAAAVLERLLECEPGHAEANNLMGAVHLKRDDLDGAEERFRRALASRPRFAAARSNLGYVYQARNDSARAIECYRQALEDDPDYIEALTNLGGVLNAIGHYAEAERHCRRAITKAPEFAGAWSNLGNALLSQGRGGEAVAAYREAQRLDPGLAEASINLYLVLQQPAYLVGVADYYEARLKKNPRDYLAHVRIAQALQAQNRWDEGRERIRKALEIRPDAVDALVLLGHNLAYTGDARGSREICLRALKHAEDPGARSSLVFNALYLDEMDGEALREEAVKWAELHAPPGAAPETRRTRRSGPLRVGYVSQDFVYHSVAYFLEPILEHHDHGEIFVACYSTQLKSDAVTERLRAHADLWRDISLCSLDEAEKMIREDEIDILVDLSGYTVGSRLPLFARKPAPVQVTYLGHPGSTGIPAIDWRIGDEVTDPPGLTELHYTERIWRMAGPFLAYRPDDHAPEVAPAPCFTKDHVTFGSFNNLLKVSPHVVATWSKLLQAVPGSALMLKSFALDSENARIRVLAEFAACGIDASRLLLHHWRAAADDHLTLYHEVDIALDPFPYNGTTTTCEALWMGVPVVSLAGDRHSCRVGGSLLHRLGLDDLVASNAAEYVDKAVALAKDRDRLAELRGSLRDRMRASPLLDHASVTRDLESAYQAMWSQHAGTSEATGEVQPDGGEPLRLHIGGIEPKAGWKIFNINPGPGVDYVGDVRDLSAFASNSVAEIYASHVLEHVDQAEIRIVLNELRRLLRKPGGRLMISVPDLETLCRLFLRDELGPAQRFHVMRMIFGGQTDAHDYHQNGLYFEYLSELLRMAGFSDIRRVDSFDLFDDASGYQPYGVPISLNVVATT